MSQNEQKFLHQYFTVASDYQHRKLVVFKLASTTKYSARVSYHGVSRDPGPPFSLLPLASAYLFTPIYS